VQNTTSLKQIAANQANAQKSTGRKTPQGRAVSKMNALKHGICSKEVLVRQGDTVSAPIMMEVSEGACA
jgi:hypothetical protein